MLHVCLTIARLDFLSMLREQRTHGVGLDVYLLQQYQWFELKCVSKSYKTTGFLALRMKSYCKEWIISAYF